MDAVKDTDSETFLLEKAMAVRTSFSWPLLRSSCPAIHLSLPSHSQIHCSEKIISPTLSTVVTDLSNFLFPLFKNYRRRVMKLRRL